MIRNERGIALVITLLVVALLTITVVEFTESVEVDQRMARNALNGLQASLLARSGINMGEAFLLHDDVNTMPQVDGFTEAWCPQAGPDAQSCLIDDSNSQLVVPPNMRLRVQIFDEGSKLNVNLTRPPTTAIWQQWQNTPNTPNPMTVFARLCEARGVDPQIAEALMNYWQTALAAADQATAGPTSVQTPGAPPSPAAPGQAALIAQQRAQILAQYEFSSLDDLGVIAGITPTAINKLRPALTAVRGPIGVNINTAPRVVLNAILNDDSAVDNIISQRTSAPLPNAQVAQTASPQAGGVRIPMGVISTIFLVRASAIVNPDPATGRGGIRRSASMIVLRSRTNTPATGTGTSGTSAGTSGWHWTLRRLDWHKEGGAALFDAPDSGTDDAASPMARDAGGMTN